MDYFNNIKSGVITNAQNLQNNKPAFYSVISLVILVLTVILYRKYRSIVRKELMEPVFIRNVKMASVPVQVTDDLIPAPLGGSGFTYSVWLYVNNWSKDLTKMKHVFSKGDVDFKSTSPGVWMLPNVNSLAILMDTAERTKGNENIIEDKNKVPKKFVETGVKGSKIPNQTSNTCKSFLAIDDTAQQAAYLSDTKECFIYPVSKDLEDNKNGTTWTKKNMNSSFMNPAVNNDILNNENNCIIVENIPLQRWFHLVIVASETSMEVYLDGKLYKTIVLKSIPKINAQPLLINLNGGFDGMINELRYYPYELKYLDVYSMYARGPTPFYLMYLFKGKNEIYEERK